MMRNGGRLLVECLMAPGATKSFGVAGESSLAVPRRILSQMRDTALAARAKA